MLRFRLVFLLTLVTLMSLGIGYFAYQTLAQQQNQPPVANPDSITAHGTTITPTGANVLSNDSDPDGDALTVTYAPTIHTSYGSGSIHWTGAISVIGGANPGNFNIPYTVTDNRGGSASSYVTVNVTNSAPTTGWDLVVLPGVNNYSDPLNILANDSDPDGDGLQGVYQSNTWIPGAVYSISNSQLVVSRDPQVAGTRVVFYQVSDSLGASSAGAVVFVLLPMDLANNAGAFCPSQGDPVNPTNGNMWIDQPADYTLPGVGDFIEIKRFYNSSIQTSGLFGHGWATQYDESVIGYGDMLLRLNMSDGRAVYFIRQNTTDPFVSYQSEIQGQIVKNGDNSYTFTTKDGRIHDFNSTGKLTRKTDWNGSQTNLAYDTSGRLVSVTDPVGRVLTITSNSNGTVNQISDAMGVVADYEYFPGTTRLKTVTYPDGSKYKFEYDTTSASGKVLLKTVKDVYDNLLETHLYDSSGRATTSERHGGVQKYEFDYTNATGSNPYTIVKHKKNAVDAYITTKYYFSNVRARNYVTKVEGICGCGGGGSEVTEFQYDSDLKLTKKVDAEGRPTDFTYDTNRNLIQVSDPLGAQKWTYNTRGQVLTYRDRVDSLVDEAASLQTPFAYAGNLRTGGPANNISYISNDVANPRSVTYFNTTGYTALSLHYIWHSSVGDSGFAIERSADNVTWSSVASSLIGTADIGGGWTRKSLKASGLTGANYLRFRWLNSNATYPWSLGLDRVDLSVNNAANTITNTYSANGDLLTTKDALGNITTLTYTSAGQVETITDARNKTTTLDYDSHGRLETALDSNGKLTAFGYDSRARLTSMTNPKSEIISFEYDLNNRLKKVIYPDANYVEHTYDLAGRKTATRDPRGNSTAYAYDNAYRLTGVTDALTHARTFGYDLMSNLTSQTDALGNTTNFQYDDFNRLKKVIYPAASIGATRLEESITYDKVGNVKTRVDTAGRTTNYLYDTANRLTRITDALTNQTNFEYNIRSQLTKVKDALNQEYVFTYDPLGRTLSQTRAGTTMSYEYDAVGNRTKRTDYSGRVTNYEYDNLNRLTTLLHGTTTESTYTYDDLSRLLTATNGAGTVTFTYDNRGRVASGTDVFGRVLEYGYDANGNRTSLELDGSTHTTYAYDVANRLTTLTDDASQSYTYGYDIADRLISKALPNGITTTYDYDGMSRLTRLKDATTAATLLDRQYSYNTANQISAITEPSRTRTFGYDNINRLTSATDSVLGSESYAFDAVGNRTSTHLSASYTTAPFNRTTAATGINQTFDSNGNTATRTQSGPSWTYTWDRENRLTQASSTGATVDFVYDALGRRVRRMEGSTDSKFTHDGEDAVLDDVASTLTKYQNGPGIDNKLSIRQGAITSYVLADHLGSTHALTDNTGAVIASNNYDSFGNATNGSFPSRYQFTGRELDPTIGLQFSRARFYDPRLGRFISEDPIGFQGGNINLYGYVSNSPTNLIDPLGLQDGPRNYLRNPFNPDSIAGNTAANFVSNLLWLDDVACWSWTLGDYRNSAQERIAAGAKLGGWSAFQAVGGWALGRGLSWAGGRLGPPLARLRAPKPAPPPPPAPAVPPSSMGVFKPSTAANFRHNLGVETGETLAGSHAHHVFPKEFADDFISAGINQHQPRYGSWWEATSHLANARRYNLEWDQFLRTNPSKDEILAFGRDIMARYGQTVNY